MKAGDPGLETWPNLDAAKYGGGHTWMPGSYDPETKLYIFGTGNPTPAYTGVARPGDNLYTCALVARATSTPARWRGTTRCRRTTRTTGTRCRTPMLIDATHQRQAAQARVGRRAQRILLHRRSRHGRAHRDDQVRHAHELGGRAQQQEGARGPRRRRKRSIPGALVSPVEGGTTNWQPSAYSPDTGLVYTQEDNSFNMLYLTDPDPRGSMGLGGKMRVEVGSAGKFLTAIDPATGKVAWRRQYPNSGGGGIGFLATAGGLLFGGDGSGNFDRARCERRQAALAHAHRQHHQRAADLR